MNKRYVIGALMLAILICVLSGCGEDALKAPQKRVLSPKASASVNPALSPTLVPTAAPSAAPSISPAAAETYAGGVGASPSNGAPGNQVKHETSQTEYGMPIVTICAELADGIDSILMIRAGDAERSGEETVTYSILRNGATSANDPIALNLPGAYYYRVTSMNGDIYELDGLLIVTDENGDGTADAYRFEEER